MKKLIMEFLGTFFLVLAIAMTGNPFAIATMFMAWLYIGGYISGAHYNPLVSLAMALVDKISYRTFLFYSLAQILGGVAAFAMNYYLKGVIIVPQPATSSTLLQAFIVEALLSAVLALVVLYVVLHKEYRDSNIFGFAIGFTLIALIAVGSPISGGLFNPAVSLGSNIFAVLMGMATMPENLLMYVAGALLGGALAAFAYRFFTQDEKRFVLIEIIKD